MGARKSFVTAKLIEEGSREPGRLRAQGSCGTISTGTDNFARSKGWAEGPPGFSSSSVFGGPSMAPGLRRSPFPRKLLPEQDARLPAPRPSRPAGRSPLCRCPPPASGCCWGRARCAGCWCSCRRRSATTRRGRGSAWRGEREARGSGTRLRARSGGCWGSQGAGCLFRLV